MSAKLLPLTMFVHVQDDDFAGRAPGTDLPPFTNISLLTVDDSCIPPFLFKRLV